MKPRKEQIEEGYFDDWALQLIAEINNCEIEDLKNPHIIEIMLIVKSFLKELLKLINDHQFDEWEKTFIKDYATVKRDTPPLVSVKDFLSCRIIEIEESL